MSPEALMQEWREAFETVRVFERADLDEIGQARLAELRSREASLAEKVRAAGLIPEVTERRSGLWAPLPLFTSSPTVAACEEGAVPQPAEPATESVTRPSETASTTVAPRVPETRPRVWPVGVGRNEVPLEEVAAPFLPSERDGFTAAQRAVVESLAISSPAPQRVSVVLADAALNSSYSPEALASALDELLLPRPYPVVERDAARRDEPFVRLTPLALEMVEFPKGQRPQVHGGFIPNLLINGCTQPLSFPPLHLSEVIEAAKVMSIVPGADVAMLMAKVPLPNIAGSHFLWAPRELFLSGTGLLEFGPRLEEDETRRVLTLSHFVPDVTPAAILGAIEAGRRAGLEGVRSAELGNDGVVRVEVDHPGATRALLRLLDSEGLLRRSWRAAFRHAGGVNWLGFFLASFFGRTRTVLVSRLMARDRALRSQLEEFDALLRAVELEKLVHQVFDAALDSGEALWGLTHLGTPEFTAHVAFKGIDATGAQPFSESSAKAILKGGRGLNHRSSLRRGRDEVADELRVLEASWQFSSQLDALVFAELDRIAAKYAGPARDSLAAPWEMSWRLIRDL